MTSRTSSSADALAGRWLVVIAGTIALGLFARHLGTLRRVSEGRFRRGFADSPVGMAIISADWRWMEVNDALCRMLGRSREELIGRSPAEATHPDDIGRSRAVVDRALDGAGHQEFVKRYVRPDGEIVWAAVDSDLRPRPPRRRLAVRPRAGHHRGARRRAGGHAPRAPAGRRRAARPVRARGAGSRGGDGPRRRDRRRDAGGRPVLGAGAHAPPHRAAARGGRRLAGRPGPPGARAVRPRNPGRATRWTIRCP